MRARGPALPSAHLPWAQGAAWVWLVEGPQQGSWGKPELTLQDPKPPLLADSSGAPQRSSGSSVSPPQGQQVPRPTQDLLVL